MDSFELNKLLGALLGAVFILFSVNLISNTIFASPTPEKPGFAIEVAEPSEGAGGAAAPAAAESVLPLLASADVAAGQATFKKCQTCHDGTKGGPNKTGPNLWNVVERPVASHEGFSYSAGMKEFSKGGTEKWTFEHLDPFLTSPKDYVKGTAMGFAGLKKTAERANLIAFLHTLSDNPVPLPAAGAAAAPAGAAAPAAGAKAAAPAAGGKAVTQSTGGAAAQPPAGNAAAPATGGSATAPSPAPATPAPANNGNSAAPAPSTAPATGGAMAPAAATPPAAASGGAAAGGATPGAGTKPASSTKPASGTGAASDPASHPTTTAQPEPDAAPKN